MTTTNVPESVRRAAQDYANACQLEVVIFRTTESYAGSQPTDFALARFFDKYGPADYTEMERLHPQTS